MIQDFICVYNEMECNLFYNKFIKNLYVKRCTERWDEKSVARNEILEPIKHFWGSV